VMQRRYPYPGDSRDDRDDDEDFQDAEAIVAEEPDGGEVKAPSGRTEQNGMYPASDNPPD
jgi:hypothetical protein